jgi:hypothetical protein
MGHRFTLVLSREITAEETAVLEKEGCAGAVFGSDSFPTNAEIPVTKLEFDVTSSPSLAEAIESALGAVKKVPDLSVPGLSVPAQPAPGATGDEASAADGVIDGVVVESAAVDGKAAKKPAAKKPAVKKPAAKKPAAKKPAAPPASPATTD